MKFGSLSLGLAVLGAACTCAGALADDSQHFSQVSFSSSNATTFEGDVDGTRGIIGDVGQPMEFKITYTVGWYFPPENGPGKLVLKSSDISDPEYALLWSDSTQNPSTYVTGLIFDGATGIYSGTPTQPGVWMYNPSVRDKEDGEDPFHGHGFWWTEYATFNNKTWIEAKDEVPVAVLPPPSAKAIMLQCTGTPNLNLLLQVDYDSGIVRVFGNDGKLAGVYHANITDDFIAWGKTSVPYFNPSSVRLDRKTGTLTTTVDYGTAPAGSCSKRSTEQKF